MRRILAVLVGCLLVTAALVAPATANPSQLPGWEVFCDFSHRLQVDPIVSPGVKPSAHMHDFYGNTGTDQFSTPTSLRAGATNCALSADKAAYWMPTVYSNGNALAPQRLHTYYRWGNITDYASIVPLTAGARLLAGCKTCTSSNRAPTSQVGWNCGIQGESQSNTPKDCRGVNDNLMVLHFFFPNCLVNGGVGSDPANYSYSSNGTCGSGKTAVPRISEDFAWDAVAPSTITLSSGSVYTAHADFMTGWSTAKMNSLTSGCINAGIQCGPLTNANPGP